MTVHMVRNVLFGVERVSIWKGDERELVYCGQIGDMDNDTMMGCYSLKVDYLSPYTGTNGVQGITIGIYCH